MITNLTDLKKCVEWLKANNIGPSPDQDNYGPQSFDCMGLEGRQFSAGWSWIPTAIGGFQIAPWVIDELRAEQEMEQKFVAFMDERVPEWKEECAKAATTELTADEFLRLMMANPMTKFASRSIKNASSIHWYDSELGLQHNYVPVDKLPGHGNTRTTDQGHFFRSGPYRVTTLPVPVVIGGENGPADTPRPYDPSPEEPEPEVTSCVAIDPSPEEPEEELPSPTEWVLNRRDEPIMSIETVIWYDLGNGWQAKNPTTASAMESVARSLDSCLRFAEQFGTDNDCECVFDIKSVTVGGKRWEVRKT